MVIVTTKILNSANMIFNGGNLCLVNLFCRYLLVLTVLARVCYDNEPSTVFMQS